MRVLSCVARGVLVVGTLAGTARAQNPAPAQPQQPPPPMTFFITSAGKGDGANLGGLAGADAWCAQLAAGLGWRGARVHGRCRRRKADQRARRIGAGPWHNAKGAMMRQRRRPARRHHQGSQPINKMNAITEKGGAQRRGRHTERARHPHRLGHGRARATRHVRHDVQQLDEQLGDGERAGRALRSHRRRIDVVELGASIARVRTGDPRVDGGGWAALLFCGQLRAENYNGE
jgi:hypothetical protein